MSDQNPLLDNLINNRQRKKVPARQDAILSINQGENSSIDALPDPPKTPDPPEEKPKEPENKKGVKTVEEIKAELATLPKTRRHSAIVLEETIDDALTRYCKDNGVTVELFLESAWIKAASDPELLEELVSDAKQRRAERTRAGKLRRLLTMLGS